MKITKLPFMSLIVGTVLLSNHAIANDSVASFSAGGIVIGKTDAIAMEKEDLFISEDKIRVSYIFRNTSNQDITTRVAFPVPEFPENPDGDVSLDIHSQNPMHFWVTIDGKTKKFATEVKKKNGNVNMTHYWTQTFPAGKPLAVVHEYNPASGGEAQMYFEGEDRADKIKTYCIDADLTKWIDKNNQPEKGSNLSTSYVDYILVTGANWKGPIGKFRLTLQKRDQEDKLSFCGSGTKKVDPRTFVLEKTNYTPDTNLSVMFIHQNHFTQ